MSSLDLALEAWRQALGEAQVDEGPQAEARYGADTGGAQRHLLGALRPTSTVHVLELVRIARQHQVTLHPISTGRNWGYGSALPATAQAVLVDLGALNRILHVDAELGVVTLEPGVTQGQLADYLDAQGLPFMVPVTGAGPNCSVLANALERGYGITPQTDHCAALTSLQAVLADGTLFQGALAEAAGTELASLFRWGLGPGLQELFVQSGLGIVLRASIALVRRPECVQLALFSVMKDEDLPAAVTAVQASLRTLPGVLGGLNLMNRHRVLAMTAPYPWDELDAQGLIPPEVLDRLGRAHRIGAWTGIATLYGTPGLVAQARTELRRIWRGQARRLVFMDLPRVRNLARLARWVPGEFGRFARLRLETLRQSLQVVNGRPAEVALALAYWRQRLTVPMQQRDPARDGCGLLWYAPLVPMKPASVRSYVDSVMAQTRAQGLEPLITLTSLNERLFDSTVPLLFERNDAQALQRARDCYAALLEQGRALGHYPYRFGVDGMALLRTHAPESTALHQRLRAALDPGEVLAPGRYA